MIMYAWGVHAIGGAGVPVAAGVTTGDRLHAQQVASDAFAGAPGAVLAAVEAVRPSPWRTAEYERCGLTWLAAPDALGRARWGALPLEARR
jgi:hypothetical protein